MTDLGIPEKMEALHLALREIGVQHAFGGALALAWCTGEVRATMDIDLNVFAGVGDLDRVLAGLPQPVTADVEAVALLRRDGQARLWWGRHPIDVFFNTTDFHVQAARRIRWEPLASIPLPFLACRDLAVFKAFFDRGKDWVDLEEMLRARSFDVADAVGPLVTYLGPEDARVARLLELADAARGPR